MAVVIDIESTGLNTNHDKVIEIAAQNYESETTLINTLINPKPLLSITQEATDIHGLTYDDVCSAPTFADVAEQLAYIITHTDAVIGYNVSFDRLILGEEFRRVGIDINWPTLVCAKQVWDKNEPNERKLINAYKRFVGEEYDQHRALNDVIATRQIMKQQVTEYKLGEWDTLYPEQHTWVGPTNHIVKDDNGDLIITFGKYKGTSIRLVHKHYWRWICSQDFPAHINDIARNIMRLKEDEFNRWVKKYV